MQRKKSKRALTDACISYLLIKKVTEVLDSSDFSSSDSEEDPVMHTLLNVIGKRKPVFFAAGAFPGVLAGVEVVMVIMMRNKDSNGSGRRHICGYEGR